MSKADSVTVKVSPFLPSGYDANGTRQIEYFSVLPESIDRGQLELAVVEFAEKILLAAGRVPMAEANACATITIELAPSTYS